MKLKTLDDLVNVQTNKWNEIHYDKWGEKVIDEKEITIIDDTPSRFVKFEELRQEAIKWVKEIQDKIADFEERATKGLLTNRLIIWEFIGKSDVLMDFFNIKEEDLQ